MKQLVSTFTDERIRFYLADSVSGEIEEFAVVKPAQTGVGPDEPAVGGHQGLGRVAETAVGAEGEAAPAVSQVGAVHDRSDHGVHRWASGVFDQ